MNDLLRLLRLFRPYRGWVVLGILLAFLTLLANVGLMALSGWFITAMALAGLSGTSMNYFTPSALIRLAAIVRTAGRYGERLVTHEATFRLLAELRVRFYHSIEPLAPAVLENYRSGDVLSRIRADIDQLDSVYLRLLLPVVVAALSTLLFVGALLFYSPLLALAELSLLLIAGVFVPWLMHHWGQQTGSRMVDTRAQLRAGLITDLQGMGELWVYGATETHAGQIEQLSRQLAQQQSRMSHLRGISQAALGLCASLAMWIILVLAIPMRSAGQITPPELVMLTLFTLASFEAVLPLPLAFQTLGETLAAARRIFSLVDAPPAVQEPDTPQAIPARLHFSFESVDFRYPTDATLALQGIHLDFPPAHRIAVVGSTGSGKSTLASLLLRFREPCAGTVHLNGLPLQHYTGESVREQIAVVSQQTHLFNATLRDNLLLARPDAGQDALDEACQLAMIYDFILAQPKGYDTWAGETGVRLSGGQAKRIAIARALLKDSPVLILDEPTEGLDPETTRQVMANIMAYVHKRQKSLLLITHRLHGLEGMDSLYVMDKGRILESGTPAELQAARGAYWQLQENGRLWMESGGRAD